MDLICQADGDESTFSVIPAFILNHQNGTLKNQGCKREVKAALPIIGIALFAVPRESHFITIQVYIHPVKALSEDAGVIPIIWNHRVVGSRTGAVARRSILGCIRGFPLRARLGRSVAPSPAPAASHVACGFPALRAPAHFTPRVMWPVASRGSGFGRRTGSCEFFFLDSGPNGASPSAGQARHGYRLASKGVQAPLEMEKPLWTPRTTGDANGNPRADPHHELFERTLGSAEAARRTAQAWDRRVPGDGREVPGEAPQAAFKDLADVSGESFEVFGLGGLHHRYERRAA